MKNLVLLRKPIAILLLLIPALCIYAQKMGENYIVFEAEETKSDLGLWEIITPGDSRYFFSIDGVVPMNETHLEFTGNNHNSGPATSPLDYVFTCPKTGKYRLAMRMHQRLEGQPEDKCNDVYIKMAGNFTSAQPSYTTNELKSNMKFYGRGTTTWGSCHTGEGGANHVQAKIFYNLIEGEEYTFTMSGRAQRTQIDYILFYETTIDMNVKSFVDLAEFNDPIYRPDHNICRDFQAVDLQYKGIEGFINATKDNKAGLDILSIPERGAWAVARTIFDGHDGKASFVLSTMQETDGESTYRLKINGDLIAEVTNKRIHGTGTPDYTIQEHVIQDTVPLNNGDTIQLEFNNATNGLVPEDDTTATSRGRWVGLNICTTGQFTEYYLNITKATVYIKAEESSTIETKLVINPLDNPVLSWKSDDTSIATVDKSGVVTGKSKGTTYVFARHIGRNLIDSCKISVSEPVTPPSGIEKTNASVLDALVYPNPFNSELIINSMEEIMEITLMNTSGMILLKEKVNGQGQIILNPSYDKVPQGIYILKLDGQNKSSTYLISRAI